MRTNEDQTGGTSGTTEWNSRQEDCWAAKFTPTLVIWGQRDRCLGEELAEPDHGDVPSLVRVERLADASHWVHHDEAERVNQLLIDFFGGGQLRW